MRRRERPGRKTGRFFRLREGRRMESARRAAGKRQGEWGRCQRVNRERDPNLRWGAATARTRGSRLAQRVPDRRDADEPVRGDSGGRSRGGVDQPVGPLGQQLAGELRAQVPGEFERALEFGEQPLGSPRVEDHAGERQ